MLDNRRDGALGIFWKCARVGERLSPYVSLCCLVMAVSAMFLPLFFSWGGRDWKRKRRSGVIQLLEVGADVCGQWGVCDVDWGNYAVEYFVDLENWQMEG